MKVLKLVFAVALLSGSISACSSASEEKTEPFSELKVLSNQPYAWDEDSSEALNVARMAMTAGVGFGFRDIDVRKNSSGGRNNNSTRVLAAGLGLADMKMFGVASAGALISKIDNKLAWSTID